MLLDASQSARESDLEEWNYLTRVAQGLEDLHSVKVLHRDLKSSNSFQAGDDPYFVANDGVGPAVAPQTDAGRALSLSARNPN